MTPRQKLALKRAQRLARPCPYCGAESGKPCVGPGGQMHGGTHYARIYPGGKR